MKSPLQRGPVAKKLVSGLRAVQQARVVDLRSFREGAARAAELQKAVATREDLADLHPAHAVYVHVQSQVSVLVEQLAELPETAKLANRIEAAQDEYMPGGPPMSPLTTSHFSCWAFFDAAAGARRETLGTCVLAVGEALGMDPTFLSLGRTRQHSRMSVYAHEGADGAGRTVLRDLATGARAPCIVPSGWRGSRGELWLARVLPPPVAALEVSTVFTTPYVLRGARESDWLAYFDRVLGPAKGDAAKTDVVLKYDIDWNEYIFAAYTGHVAEAIFLTGLPDVPSSLPHYSPRGD